MSTGVGSTLLQVVQFYANVTMVIEAQFINVTCANFRFYNSSLNVINIS